MFIPNLLVWVKMKTIQIARKIAILSKKNFLFKLFNKVVF